MFTCVLPSFHNSAGRTLSRGTDLPLKSLIYPLWVTLNSRKSSLNAQKLVRNDGNLDFFADVLEIDSFCQNPKNGGGTLPVKKPMKPSQPEIRGNKSFLKLQLKVKMNNESLKLKRRALSNSGLLCLLLIISMARLKVSSK